MRLGTGGVRAYGRTMLHEGESAFVALSWGGHPPTTLEEAQRALRDQTRSFWRDWLSTATFPDHRWRPYIERSALALKGLSYAPTGAIMAASTTSLPETPGGERNWDYRYTWIRDTAFMLRALHGLGFDWEAFEYFAFILDALRGLGRTAGDAADGFNIQIMYGIGGETDLTEHTLDHLSGYRDSRPVRTGNGAYNQRQHDVWGMLLDAVGAHIRNGGQMAPQIWDGIAGLVDTAIAMSHEPDQGIWEMRGKPQHFVASKVMCWVAAERGMHLAESRGDTERVEKWQKAANRMHAEICKKGVDARGDLHAVLRHRRARRVAAADPDHGIPAPRRRAGPRDRPRDRRRAHQRRPRAPLQGGVDRRRPLRRRGHVHDLLLLVGFGAGDRR